MLDKNSKHFLKKLISESPDHPNGIFTYDFFGDLFTDAETRSQINYLISEGYLKEYELNGRFIGYELSHKGWNYNNFEIIKIRSFIVNSFFVPIIVTIITTLILHFLNFNM